MKKYFCLFLEMFMLLVGAALVASCYPTPTPDPKAAPTPQSCVIPPGESRTCTFTDESGAPFVITVPVQDPKRELTLTKTSTGTTPPKKDKVDVTPIRLLFNFDATSGKDKVITFNPPLTIVARYNSGDLEKVPAKDPKKLTLFLFDRDHNSWTVLKTAVSVDPPTLTASLASLLGLTDPEGVGY